MKKTELVFIPAPARGHIVSMVEFANELLSRDDRFSATILVVNTPYQLIAGDSNNSSITTTQSLPNFDADRIRYVDVPKPFEIPPLELMSESVEKYVNDYMASHKPKVKEIIVNHFSSKSIPLSGLVLDFFCITMNDVAGELGVPSYVYYTSGAGSLGLILYLHNRHVHCGTEFEESDPESYVPSYVSPVPTRGLPSFAFSKPGYASMVSLAERMKKTRGIIVNSVYELESHAVSSLLDGVTPTVYTVGPILDLNSKYNLRSESDKIQRHKIMTWLDKQPSMSVVFLCFGSAGCFGATQLREIAIGLERSGQRFLWSVRKAPQQGKFLPEDYADMDDQFLPQGFLERTREMGLLCGWAPQVEILAHKAVGGFVSHCGWNSILESLWFGVPIATWPIYAEQQINAFQMVKDLGLAVELRLDYRMQSNNIDLVRADEIERAVRCVMAGDDHGREIRNRVVEMSKMCRRTVVSGGSSFESFGRLIDAILAKAHVLKY